jgi:biopolymer transport protein ExbB
MTAGAARERALKWGVRHGILKAVQTPGGLAAWIEFRLRRIQKTINSALVTILSVPVATTESESALETHDESAPATGTRTGRVVEYSGDEHQGRLANATG